MKVVTNLALLLAAISFILALYSRLTLTPLAIMPGRLEAEALLQFTNTCLLVAIVALLLGSKK